MAKTNKKYVTAVYVACVLREAGRLYTGYI